MFGFFSQPRFLSNQDLVNAISKMPQNIIDIIELYEIDMKYISSMSGLLQTKPILENYDLSEIDRMDLIKYAVQRTAVMKDKEKKYLDLIEGEIESGDYTFMDLHQSLLYRVKYRDSDDISDLKNIKFLQK